MEIICLISEKLDPEEAVGIWPQKTGLAVMNIRTMQSAGFIKWLGELKFADMDIMHPVLCPKN